MIYSARSLLPSEYRSRPCLVLRQETGRSLPLPIHDPLLLPLPFPLPLPIPLPLPFLSVCLRANLKGKTFLCLLSFSCALVFSERFLREVGVLDKTREAKKASERERERKSAKERAHRKKDRQTQTASQTETETERSVAQSYPF